MHSEHHVAVDPVTTNFLIISPSACCPRCVGGSRRFHGRGHNSFTFPFLDRERLCATSPVSSPEGPSRTPRPRTLFQGKIFQSFFHFARVCGFGQQFGQVSGWVESFLVCGCHLAVSPICNRAGPQSPVLRAGPQYAFRDGGGSRILSVKYFPLRVARQVPAASRHIYIYIYEVRNKPRTRETLRHRFNYSVILNMQGNERMKTRKKVREP